jgi:hypothetical protein
MAIALRRQTIKAILIHSITIKRTQKAKELIDNAL